MCQSPSASCDQLAGEISTAAVASARPLAGQAALSAPPNRLLKGESLDSGGGLLLRDRKGFTLSGTQATRVQGKKGRDKALGGFEGKDKACRKGGELTNSQGNPRSVESMALYTIGTAHAESYKEASRKNQ